MMPSPDKVALITDADMPIGRAIALGLARAGWHVVVHYGRDVHAAQITAEIARYQGSKARVVRCDLTDDIAVQNMLQEMQEQFGRVCCIVNYGGLTEQDSVSSFSVSRLEAHLSSHLTGPVILARALHGFTLADQRSVVVNLLDQKLLNLQPDFLSYTLANSALQTATRLLAQALAPRTRVVAVACDLLPRPAASHGSLYAVGGKQTMNRTTLEDMIAAIRFAAESPSVTGSMLLVNGGQHLLPTSSLAANQFS